jgi:hypothetical protein
VQAERNTKKASFFLLPRRRLIYLKLVQAEHNIQKSKLFFIAKAPPNLSKISAS